MLNIVIQILIIPNISSHIKKCLDIPNKGLWLAGDGCGGSHLKNKEFLYGIKTQ